MAKNNLAAVINREVAAGRQAWYSTGMINEQDLWLSCLKEMGVLGPKRLMQLHELLKQKRHEYHNLALQDDSIGDKDIAYTKYKVDEGVRAAVGEDLFLPWETRYDLRFQSFGIRCIDMREAYNDYVNKTGGKGSEG